MTAVLGLLLVNAALGAWDTLWYHEYRARLSAHLEHTRTELRLHVLRDVVYVLLYGVLAWWRPSGWAAALVGIGLAVEITATLADFVVEDRDRPAIGGLAAGERVLHSVMAIVYGAMLAFLVPVLIDGGAAGFVRHDAPEWMTVAATLAAAGIANSGLRDALALAGHDPIWTPRAVAGPIRDSADCELRLAQRHATPPHELPPAARLRRGK